MQDLKERTFQFAVKVANLVSELPANVINRCYVHQLVRSSSSVGANYRAARRAKSDADFINKLKIVEEEADESVYFLELLKEFNTRFDNQISMLVQEGNEIVKIIVASIITARKKRIPDGSKKSTGT